MERIEKIFLAVSAIPKLFTLERIVHATMIAFALGGISNATAFLTAAGHDPFPSLMIAAALGGALVATSMALMHVDFNHEMWRFIVMATIVVGIAWLSGTIQYQVYLSHGMKTGQAALIGYGLPAICEGLLAAYIGLYAQTQRKARIRNATDGAAEQVAGAVAEAMGSIDVTKVRKYVDRRVDTLTRAIVDQTISELMPTVTPDASQDTQTAHTDDVATAADIDANVTQNSTQDATNVEPTVPNLSQNVDESPVFETALDAGRARANENKRNAATQRRLKFLTVLNLTSSKDELNFAKVGRELGDVSGQTISNDLKWLESQGYWLNGSDWRMTDQGRNWMDGVA